MGSRVERIDLVCLVLLPQVSTREIAGQPTTGENDEESDAATASSDFDGPRPRAAVQIWQWRVGVDLPPFISSSEMVVRTVLDLASGTALEAPSVHIFKAIAIQIFLLFQVSTPHTPHPT
eukprot:CAMPEP_0183361990 /NCGR_PEP_ID=MMETSP0164_2-20130417/65714_1 /TAXON_ID=221442 /ORGANISM="Coccolithus pelagicus ssp braarudi, Strain PLY182g" /LENGTH=119 /DNA_ID=CAMNT_0025536733 /DNA_START=288 /DNA_END=643 /DNA_ORIENTATION=+